MGRLSNDEKARRAAAGTTSAPAIRPQIKSMSGTSAEELKNTAPESTAGASTSADTTEVKTRKPRTPKTVEVDPLMADARYAKAIGGLKGFGGARIIKRGFDAAAIHKQDDSLSLTADEFQTVDDYFYVIGKRSTFDPTAHWFGLLFLFVIMMAELCVPRLMRYTNIGKWIETQLHPEKKVTAALPDDAEPEPVQ